MRRMLLCCRGSFGLVAVLCTLLGSVAGCTGSDPPPAPTTRHPGTAGTFTTTTPSADPTDLQYAAAIAAVQKMYAEYNGALGTGRTSSYKATFATSCRYCQANAAFIDKTAAQGRRIVGGRFTLTRLQKATINGEDVFVQGWASQAAARIEKSGRTLQKFQAAPAFLAVWKVRRVRQQWIVTNEDVPR